MGDSLPAQGSS